MNQKFTQAFKIQAVEKALGRADGVGVLEIAESLGMGYSTLQKWIVKANNNELNRTPAMTKEKRPQDWNQEERLNMVIECGSLSEECRTIHENIHAIAEKSYGNKKLSEYEEKYLDSLPLDQELKKELWQGAMFAQFR